MDLASSHPFWLLQDGLLHVYPPLHRDIECDVAIIGADITGAFIADRFASLGMHVVVLDRRDVACGSTSASTSILQYEIDVHLADLAPKIGVDYAQRAYRLCHSAIDNIEQLALGLTEDGGFARKQSIYAASTRDDVTRLREEWQARRDIGIQVELLEGAEVRSELGLPLAAALRSSQAAVCNAYRMAHALFRRAVVNGAELFDRTEVMTVEYAAHKVILHTNRGGRVTARKLIFATGYESQEHLSEKVATLHSTYAIISQPLETLTPWNDDLLFWESSRPYLYFRATPDRRLLAGGEDDFFKNASVRDRRVPKKADRIATRVRALLPDLDFETEFAWAGTFGETKDGLPYIGAANDDPNVLYALCFGGNGITFCSVAADILADLTRGIANEDAAIFRFGR